ncbi:MAG: flavin monoamine oxidase family protein [Caulobacterales bacterium]
MFDVAVVGAGTSGLTAARDLKRAGLDNIVVLEARDRVGGRSYNQTLAGGLVADAGPTWVGPGQTAILDLLRELGIGTVRNYDTGDTVVLAGGQVQRVPTTASPITDASFFERMNAMAGEVPAQAPWLAKNAAEYDAMSYGDYLKTQRFSDADRRILDITCQLTFGGLPEDISLLYVLFYINAAGGYERLESMEGGAQQDRIQGGTQAISKRMAADLGDVVRLGEPVKAIAGWDRADGSSIRLATPSGTVQARRVILALSPSQASDIDFAPGLPKQRAELMANWPRGGAAIKVAVAYAKPFWREKGLCGQSVLFDGPYLWAVDVSPADGSAGQLMSFTKPAAGPPIPPDQRRAQILEAHARCFGPEALNPIGYVEQDWSQETYTRGCVSPLTKGVLSRYGAALRAPSGRLIWAGTETAEIWMGYMDGAVRSGHRAALEALRDLARVA